jgi:hypothetical protein
MHLGRPGVHLPELPPEHKFLRGNHDDPTLCRAHANYLGDYGYLPDDDLFCVSGAQTASWRVLGNSKYRNADEEMSDSVLNEMIASYTEMRPNIVISHTAPSEGAKEIRGFAVQPFFEDWHSKSYKRRYRPAVACS